MTSRRLQSRGTGSGSGSGSGTGSGSAGVSGRTSRISSSVSSMIGAMRPSAERPSRRLSMTQPLSCRVSPDLTGFRSPCWRIAANSSQIGVGSASTGKSSPSTRRTARAVCSERVMAAPWPARTWLQSCAGSPSHATSGIDSNSQATTHSIGHCRSRAALCGGVKEGTGSLRPVHAVADRAGRLRPCSVPGGPVPAIRGLAGRP